MAAPPPGKRRTGPKSQSSPKKTTRAKAPRPAKGKTQARKKPAPKKKKSPRRKWTFLGRTRPALIWLGLGLALGVAATIAALYFLAGPPKAARPGPVLYEENRRLDRQVKQLDQALFLAFSDLKIPEDEVRFLRVTPLIHHGREWDHALIEVVLPAELEAEAVTRKLKDRLGQVRLRPPPDLVVNRAGAQTEIEVRFDGLLTHTLRLASRRPAAPPRPEAVPAPAGERPRAAIVIDDLGRSLSQARCFLRFKGPLAFSVLPFEPHSREVARMAHQQGQVVMLHLPMQPAHWPEVKAGPGTLLISMDRAQVLARVRAALEAVPFVAGVNNHMGSRFTEDQERMGWVVQEIKARGLFFLDSRTTTRSRAYAAAKSAGLKRAQRSLFLDNIQTPEAIRVQIRRLVTRARQQGQAVGIGHPYPVTCQVLQREYNYLDSRVELVPVTSLLR